MDHRLSFWLPLLVVASTFLVACDDAVHVAEGEGTPQMAQPAAEIVVPKDQVRLERLPTPKGSMEKRVLQWRLNPGDSNLKLACGITGSKGHGSVSSSGTAIGPASSSGMVITFEEKTVDGKGVMTMVRALGSEESADALAEAEPQLEKSELKWFDVRMHTSGDSGESTTSTSGIIPGSVMEALDGFFSQSEKDGVNFFPVGKKFVLARFVSARHGTTLAHGSGEDGMTIIVDGKPIPLDQYEHASWALWIRAYRE